MIAIVQKELNLHINLEITLPKNYTPNASSEGDAWTMIGLHIEHSITPSFPLKTSNRVSHPKPFEGDQALIASNQNSTQNQDKQSKSSQLKTTKPKKFKKHHKEFARACARAQDILKGKPTTLAPLEKLNL